MSGHYVDVVTAAALLGETERNVQLKVKQGIYKTVTRKCQRGGASGESYLIKVSSLPREAQMKYWAQFDAVPVGDFDLVGYTQRFGKKGEDELERRQKAAREGLALQTARIPNLTAELEALARDYGTSSRNLRRWIDGYESRGLAGIANATNRSDKGMHKSICLAAQREAYRLYLQANKRTKTTVFEMLNDLQRRLGPDACLHCAHNPESEHFQPDGFESCGDPNKCGLVVPASRQTVSDMLSEIPEDMKTLARRGVKAWKNEHMPIATRAKPTLVNQVWFGDHHQLDCFALDHNGKPVRPWLTAWYDAATGALVGWVLSVNPNTDTITEAFIKAVGVTNATPFYGLPLVIYVDNGKDYRSKVFEGASSETSLGRLNSSFAALSVIQLFNIEVTHAQPYHAWAKTVERFFRTFEDKWIREVPGWCGNSPEERPETFNQDLKRWIATGTLWTLDEMFAYIRDVVLPAYHSRPHEGHGGKTPYELYEALPRARADQPGREMLYAARESFTTRTIRQDGIHFNKEIYWDAALMYHVGKEIVIRYSQGDLSNITVLLDDHFLCNTEQKERFSLVGESPEKLAAHLGGQKRQRANTEDRIRRATRSAFSEELDAKRNVGNLTGIEYEKAYRAKTARKKEQAERKACKASGDTPVGNMLLGLYDEFKQRTIVN